MSARSGLPVPTRTAFVAVGLGLSLEVIGRLQSHTLLPEAGALAFGAVIADLALCPRIGRVRVRFPAVVRGRAREVAKLPVDLDRSCLRWARRSTVLMTIRSAALGNHRVVVGVQSGQKSRVVLDAHPSGRGYWSDLGSVNLEVRSPLGGFRRGRSSTSSTPVWIFPAQAQPGRLDIEAANRTVGSSISRLPGVGADVVRLRGWYSGDRRSQINWRATARVGELIVTEHLAESRSSLVVVAGFDPDTERWEASICRACATTSKACRDGHQVFLVQTDQVSLPQTPREVEEWFAVLRPELQADPSTVSKLRPRGGSLLVVGSRGRDG
jgi:uncharacterized protein (DUF58 family)